MNIYEKNGKYATYDKFSVEKIAYDDNRQITGIAIKNQKGERVFVYNNTKKGEKK